MHHHAHRFRRQNDLIRPYTRFLKDAQLLFYDVFVYDYEQKFSKLKSPRDSGTGQAVPGQDTPAGNSGDGEQSSEMRPASTDISEKGVELIQD